MAATSPVPLDISPGILKAVSTLSAKGRWVDCDHGRFVAGKFEKIGGWTLYLVTQLDGMARGAYAWTTSGNIDILAAGTYRKLYSISDALQDITPLRETGTLGAAPFATTNGSPTVTVTDATHALVVGAKVHFSGAAAVAGITISGEYAVVTVPTANSYTITHSANANATTTGGGAAVAYQYEINPGETDTVYGVGYGSGTYGSGTYGTPRAASTLAIEMRYWSIGNYGTELIATPSGGGIYLWDEPGAAARAAILAGAPTSVRYTFVTAERYIFALGTTTPMTVQWPDVDDPTNWTPAEGNTANTRVLQDGNKLMAGVVFNDAINLIWSDHALYIAQYLPGSDFFYDISVVKTGAGLVGQGAFCVTSLGVFWLSGADLYLYNGSVDTAPNFNDVRDWFFRRFNRTKAHKAVMEFNRKKNEVQLHYTSIDASENDSYLLLSLDTMSWAPGTAAGVWGITASAVRRNPTKEIFGFHADSYIYEHESGVDAAGAALEAYIESGIIALGDGAVDMDVIGYQPDFERQTGDLTLDVKVYERPRDEASDTLVDECECIIADTDTLVDMILGGRFAKHRITSDVIGGDFRLGLGVFEVGPAGRSR